MLDRFERYLDVLRSEREKATRAEQLIAENPGLGIQAPDWPRDAWEALASENAIGRGRPYSPRQDGCRRAVPNVTLKIPTGGGKTLLAAQCSARVVNSLLGQRTGLILWIVPNEAIYRQTKRVLTNREHPYRQALDRAASGRVKILEKESPLDRADIDENLCVMLLMLPSANRQTRETLRLFKDRGSVRGFFPAEGDLDAHHALKVAIPNLDCYGVAEADETGRTALPGQIRDSLGNVLRLCRPVIVMDEGHKAFSELAYRTLYDFNPCFVLELSATPVDADRAVPPRWANWLVNVNGEDLQAEEMIKTPINVQVRAGDDWRDCLRAAWEQTETLQREADRLLANSLRYIRPILLVQVERTGREQVESGLIHSDHAVDYLKSLGVPEEAIAVKTSDVDDLKDPEKADLLSPANMVRVVITKQALQEGWDCPFAYVLCSLASTQSLTAMTQLVGRILRQPEAQRTGIQALDECYVVCYRQGTKDMVDAIIDGLKQDGMGDLAGQVKSTDSGGSGGFPVIRRKRAALAGVNVFLPLVLWESADGPRALDWWGDVLGWIDWDGLLAEFAEVPGAPADAVSAGATARIDISAVREPGSAYGTVERQEGAEPFDPVFATRALSDLVPNPWHARRYVGSWVEALSGAGWSESDLDGHSGQVIEMLRGRVKAAIDTRAREVFEGHLREKRIQFRLQASPWNWKLPESEELAFSSEPVLALRQSDGGLPERSWLEPIHRNDLNDFEYKAAMYLDEHQTVAWWYRNVVAKGYALQGWQRNRVYPDFLFALVASDGGGRLVALETKGTHLEGNPDTEYKRALMRVLTEACETGDYETIGTLAIEDPNLTRVECRMVVQEGWREALAGVLTGRSAGATA